MGDSSFLVNGQSSCKEAQVPRFMVGKGKEMVVLNHLAQLCNSTITALMFSPQHSQLFLFHWVSQKDRNMLCLNSYDHDIAIEPKVFLHSHHKYYGLLLNNYLYNGQKEALLILIAPIYWMYAVCQVLGFTHHTVILTAMPWRKYHLHFIDKETEV